MLKQLKVFDYLYVLFITFSVTLYFKFYPLNVDSTWILHCAKEMLNGSTLYVDMIDVNPPIIFIYSTVAVLFSKITSISLIISYIFIILVLIFTSLYIVVRILEKINNLSKNDLRLFSYFLFFSLTILISYNFGQREHLLIIFIFPYFIATLFKIKMNIKFRLIISTFSANITSLTGGLTAVANRLGSNFDIGLTLNYLKKNNAIRIINESTLIMKERRICFYSWGNI